MKLEFYRWFFEKYSGIKFHENMSGGSRVVPCGQTDGRKDTMKLISKQFYERALNTKGTQTGAQLMQKPAYPDCKDVIWLLRKPVHNVNVRHEFEDYL